MAPRGALGRAGATDRAELGNPRRPGTRAHRQTVVDRGAAAAAGATARARTARGQRVRRTQPRAGGRIGSGRARGRAAGGRLPADPDRRPTNTVGLVLCARDALLQLAAHTGSARSRRLRRRPRALSPARSQSLAVVLVASRATPPRLARAARMAARVWTRAARVQPGGASGRTAAGETTPSSRTGLAGEQGGARESVTRPPPIRPGACG